MAQVPFGVCHMQRVLNAQANMTPKWNGEFTQPDTPRCKGVDFKRRQDVAQRYGTGTPVHNLEPDEWHPHLTRPDKRPTELVRTEQGPIILPFGESHHPEYYMPTANTLNVVPLLGSKMNYLSDRYYNR
jgi:hypothetical protein